MKTAFNYIDSPLLAIFRMRKKRSIGGEKKVGGETKHTHTESRGSSVVSNFHCQSVYCIPQTLT